MSGSEVLLGHSDTGVEKRTSDGVHFEQRMLWGTNYKRHLDKGRIYTKEEALSAAGHELELGLTGKCQRESVEPHRSMG